MTLGLCECLLTNREHPSQQVTLTYPNLIPNFTFPIAEPVTEILGGPDIYVDRGSTLNVTCVVWAESKAPDYIFWSHNDRVSFEQLRLDVSLM